MSELEKKPPESDIEKTARCLKNLMALIDAHEFKGFTHAVAVKEMGEFVSSLYKEIEGQLPKPDAQPLPVAAPEAPVEGAKDQPNAEAVAEASV